MSGDSIKWEDIEEGLNEKYDPSLVEYIKLNEINDDCSGRNEEENNKMFEEWWNQWTDEKITELEERWFTKRGAYVMLQLAFLGLKKKGLCIEIVTSKDKNTIDMLDGDTLDITNRGTGETDIFIEFQYPVLSIKNASVVKAERKEKKQ